MSLILNIKYVDGLSGRGKRYIKANFRDREQFTASVVGESIVYIGDQLVWPLARRLDRYDNMTLMVYTQNRVRSDKFIGCLTISLQALLENPLINIRENLTDKNLVSLSVVMELQLELFAADREELSQNQFDYTMFHLDKQRRRDGRFKLPSSGSRRSGGLSDDDNDGLSLLDDEYQETDPSIIMNDEYKDHFVPVRTADVSPKPREYQLHIMLYEGYELAGTNISPQIEIMIGETVQSSNIKPQNKNPFFMQPFIFSFYEAREAFLSRTVLFRAIDARLDVLKYIIPGHLIGDFVIDIKNVYTQPQHAFFQKWAILLDPKDPASKSKGQIKIDIYVIEEGQGIKKPIDKVKVGDPENIEANLLLPKHIPQHSDEMAIIRIKIYRAEKLPSMSSPLMSAIKSAFSNEKGSCNSFVQIAFSGHTAQTSVVKNNNNPEWNQEVIFTELFPPFSTRIRLSVFDSNTIEDELISQHFLDITNIMMSGKDGYLPTYGPSWINLYGNPRNFVDGEGLRNKVISADGIAYRGRILIALKTKILPYLKGERIGVMKGSTPALSDKFAGNPENVFLFATIFEASVIDCDIAKFKKPIKFQITMGRIGDMSDESWVKTELKSEEARLWNQSDSEAILPDTYDKEYYHLPYGNKKPCMFLVSNDVDSRARLCSSNILDKLQRDFESDLFGIRHKIKKEKFHRASALMRIILGKFAKRAILARTAVRVCRGTAVKTVLDRENTNRIKNELAMMCIKVKQMRERVNSEKVARYLGDCEALVKRIEQMKNNPQHALPDIFIWMFVGDKRVAFTRVRPRDIFYSAAELEIGKDCGHLTKLNMRRPEFSRSEDSKKICCQLTIYMWLGLVKEIINYKENIPYGYDENSFKNRTPPREIVYRDHSAFEFRCKLFLARNLFPSDDTGLSDPFVRIIIADHVITSCVINETLNPLFDQIIVLPRVEFPYTSENLKKRVPTLTVELFDSDSGKPDSKSNYIGRVFVRSVVFTERETYSMPKLEFWNLKNGALDAGELLASFEFIEIDYEDSNIRVYEVPTLESLQEQSAIIDASLEITETDRPEGLIRVPAAIRPVLTPYRLEAMLWGIRRCKKIMLMTVNRPELTVEIAGKNKKVEIEDLAGHPFFKKCLISIDLHLPEDYRFWPPITLQCNDSRAFKSRVLVGNYSVMRTPSYRFDFGEEDDDTVTVVSASTVATQNSENGSLNGSKSGSKAGSIVSKLKSVAGSLKSKNGSVKNGSLNGSLAGSKHSLAPISEYEYNPMFTIDEMDNVVAPPLSSDDVTLEQKTPGSIIDLEPATEIPKDVKETMDWWSRFFVSLENFQEKPVKMTSAEEQVLSSIDPDMIKTLKLEEEEEDEDDVIDAPDDDSNLKKRKKRRFKKLTLKDIKDALNKILPDPKKNYLGEEENEEYPYKYLKDEDASYQDLIEKILIYDCALEDVPEYAKFERRLNTFPLYKGIQKDNEGPNDRLVATFKGNFCLYPIDREEVNNNLSDENFKLYPLLPERIETFDVVLRVYIVRGNNLTPQDEDGLADPYLILRAGDNVVSHKEEVRKRTVNPVFGIMTEMDVKFPQSSYLTIQVYDKDRIAFDTLIGETHIDLENRFFTKNRATIGLASRYETFGYNRWRDPFKPSQILSELVAKINEDELLVEPLEEPVYEPIFNRATFAGRTFDVWSEIDDGSSEPVKSNEPLALEILTQWHTFDFGAYLVPEHIETRTLEVDNQPGISQGQLQLWIDIYDKLNKIPSYVVNIEPRKPEAYELRVIVLAVAKAPLVDTSMFSSDKSVDVLMKGWMLGANIDQQATDVHYKSLDGKAVFNWRFVFPFKYIPASDCMIREVKSNIMGLEMVEEMEPCKFFCQIYNSNLIGSDEFLGEFSFRLSKIPKPAREAKACGLFIMDENDEEIVPKFSLFKNNKARGWWPLKGMDKKTKEIKCHGKVELEFQLLTAIEAENNPAGLGREPPNELEEPTRPYKSILDMLNPLAAIKYLICVKFLPVIIKILVILAFALIAFYFIYNIPNYLAKKMLGA